MDSPVLSYIITTRNRLPFLKITLERLIENVLPDEEIVVIDSNSNDGSYDYLNTLFKAGKIHQFVSEADKNQAHGWNKAMLMAKGLLIKKVIDDDIFCYSAIRSCRHFMLANPEVDVLISNDLSSSLTSFPLIEKHSRLTKFMEWKEGKTPSFTFGDVHMLIRKSALAYIGLYNTSFTMMDWEYALRISYLRANIAYYSGYNALSVSHEQTISSLKNIAKIKAQGKKAEFFYEYVGDNSKISIWSKIKILIGKILLNKESKETNKEELESIYSYLQQHIDALNRKGNYVFLKSNS